MALLYMSQYIGNQDLFFQPEVKQYGSHMVMTNVMLPSKSKYLNVDSHYSDNYGSNTLADYNITFPDRIENVKSLKVRCAEIPVSFYNISAQLNNNVFNVSDGTTMVTFTIDDGYYDESGLTTEINNALSAQGAPFNQLVYSISNKKSVFTNNSASTLDLQFDVSPQGATDLQNVTFKFGWLLGFRDTTYSLEPFDVITSVAFIDLQLPRYLYLVINEFTNGNQFSFVTMLQNSQINKSQIIARIAMDYTQYPFGTVVQASDEKGNLVSDTRVYNGPVNIQRMNVQLVNERGVIMNLNGLNTSFCLELDYE